MEKIKPILQYFPDLKPFQIAQLQSLDGLYNYWNQRINVISRKDIANLYLHHILHSLAIAKVITFTPRQSVLDVGTGGGFPGIPLAILFPKIHFQLIDSVGKKIGVVNEISKALKLENISARQVRVEEVKEKFDYIVCRAVTNLPRLVKLSLKLIKPGHSQNSMVCLKGGDLTREINNLAHPYKIYDIQDYFSEPFFETKKIIQVFSK